MQLICGIRPITPGKRRANWKKKSLALIPRYVVLCRDVLIFTVGDFTTMGESKKKESEREREKKNSHLNPIQSV